MSNKTKRTATQDEAMPSLVPGKRFPEFRSHGQWKLFPLRDLAERGKTKNRDEKIERVLTNSAEFGVVDQRDFFDKDIAIQGKLENYVVVELGDYVYNPRISATAPVGPISKNQIGTGVMSPLYTVFRFKNQENGFYQHYFKTTGWHTYMRQASSTGARHDRMAISSDDFMAMPLPVAPAPEEQQKIADCLSSVDELMAAQARKVGTLKTHKKGLMQQLFPREGETLPLLRFSEFKQAGKWGIQTIGDVFRLINGCAFKPEDWKPTGTPIIRIQNLNDPSAEFNYSRTPATERNRVEPGDLLFAWSGTLGTSFGARIWNGPSGVLNQHIFKVLMDERKITLQFALLVLARVEEEIARKTHGFKASFVHVKKSDLVKVKLVLPSRPEQQRIASCLSSLDALIVAESQKLEALKTHKKGLMQQLFPSPEEAAA
ncbi:MAG: restriction endonuclease subunit S [Hydrogenophaga sp.]|uniref:restriction endonuclease subunit S n=1 Tax=Hydrogenophaga sp. TaxID=1904254 RepID=UPI0027315516|nr:restriction endonuclease subunit S [Hydrogenophaga sp.]MDP2406268.1 restriction endonuclease subunit S [Hydrogenophaga sp.]MDZ4173161.1 restriction endonuclease subunit S [Hydrogenophaga sp.]